ncbi:MAG: 6-phosphogluconolactonase [Alphaproteobacteria bacterium]|nr:6-phosphogluconolactonase [Alphaproteobacteria bacterium]
MTWRITDTPDADAAALVTDLLGRVARERGECVLAVPGGSTPGPVLNALRDGDPALLQSLTVTLVDERHLPVEPDAPWQQLPADSNTRLLYAELVDGAPMGPLVIGWARRGTLEAVRARLAAEVPDPGVLLLGMGPDGHVASLFPGHAVMEASARVVAIDDSPKPPPERLSMSLSLLNRAAYAVVVVKGAAKAEAVRRAWERDPLLPTTHLTAPEVHWIVDRAAASHLPESP